MSPLDAGTDWRVYRNQLFEIRYPGAANVTGAGEDSVLMRLPFPRGSTLIDKRVRILTTTSTPERCLAPGGPLIVASSSVQLNGILFQRVVREEFQVGSQSDVEDYSTMRGDHCVRLEFILQSVNPERFASSPPPAFDKVMEAGVFTQMLSTFRFVR